MSHQSDPELRGVGLAWGFGLAGLLVILVALAAGPVESARDWQRAENHFHRREYTQALQDYREILARQDQPASHLRMGEIYLAQARFSLARDEFGASLSLDLASVDALLGAGLAARGLGEEEQALGLWQKALAVDPTNSQAHYLLATAHIAGSNLPLARQELEAAIHFSTGNQLAEHLLGLLLALEDADEAISYLSLARRGRDEELKEQEQEMIAFLSESVGAEESATFFAQLGEKYLNVGQPILARESLRRAIAIDPGLDQAQAYLGYVYLALGEGEKARITLLGGREMYPGNPLFPFFLAQSYRQGGELAAADNYLVSALVLDPANPAFYAEKGAIAWESKDYPAAREAYRKCAQLAPQNVGFQLLRAEYHLTTLLWIDEGLEAAQKAVALDPQNPQAWELLGWAYYLTGEPELALDLLQKSLDLDPDRASAYFRIGEVFSDLGRIEEAGQAYQRALDVAIDDYWRGRTEQALARLRQLLP